ncbi:hypothetical protein ACFOOL_06840 [Devosia honganensis]|uniref:DUF4145 domain-containing protein n=1 Tax=Devosia honganensis TaxID=1610527 RepID=A0ABV7WZS6_9HYPH
MWAIPEDLNEQFEASTDRAAAIVGGAYVEECLLRALKWHLHKDTKHFDRLFHHSGPLSSFEMRIRIAVLVGLINGEFAHDLLIIKDVRNEFAHKLDLQSFDAQKISSWLNNLSLLTINRGFLALAEKRDPTPREIFQGAAGEAGGMLSARRPTMMPTPPTYRS